MKKFRSSQPVFHCEYLQEYYKAKLFNILGIFKYTPVDSQLLSVTSHGLNYVHFQPHFRKTRVNKSSRVSRVSQYR